MLRRAAFIALLGAFTLCSGTASAADRYASANSTRTTGSCTLLPCTLPYATSQAQAGETVWIMSGTYALEGDLTAPAGVRLSGGTGERPVVNTPHYLQVAGVSPQQTGRLEHLEVRGGVVLSSNSTGSDLIVRGSSRGVLLADGALLRNALVVTTGSATSAVTGGTTTPGTVLNSTLIATGGQAYGAFAHGEVENVDGYCSAYPEHLVLRNVIARGGKADLRAEGADGGECDGTGKLDVASSNFRTSEVSAALATIDAGAGNQTAPALTDDAAIFADAVLFRQKEGAPTRDAGAADPLVGPVDLDGDARVQEAAVDIGADELPAPPLAETLAATDVAQTTATLQARVTPNASATTVVFEYGPTAAYGARTAEQVVPAGAAATDLQARVEGLAPGTAFHYRVLANAAGTQPRRATGADATFATLQPPPIVVQQPPLPLPQILTGLAAKQSIKLAAFRKKGLKVRFTLGRPGTSYAVKLTARLRNRTVTLAEARGTAGPGARTLVLKPSRSTAALLRTKRRVKAKLTVSTTPAATASRSLTIRRSAR